MKQNIRIQQKETTRQHILDKAQNLFAEKGILMTSTIDLAKSAQVSHGTLFLHFSTRDNLIFQVINDFGIRLSHNFFAVIKENSGLKNLLQAHLHVLQEYEDFYTTLIKELPSLSDQVKSRFFTLQSSISKNINMEIKKEIQLGKIKEMESSQLFNTWIAILHYYLIHRDIFSPGKSLIATKGDALIAHYLMLILL